MPQYFSDLEVKALLIHKIDHYNEEQDDSESEGDETDYEEEFFFDKKSQCFRCGLNPGSYMIVAKGENLKELNQYIEVADENITYEFNLKKPQKIQVYVWVHDASNGEPLDGVMLRWKKKTTRHITEGLTAKEGVYGFVVEENSSYIIEAERKG
jgi:hypothetical protein